MINQEIAQRVSIGFLLVGGMITFIGALVVYFYKKGKIRHNKHVKHK